MRIYLCGPVTGTEDYRERFRKAEATLAKEGFEVVNPVKIVRKLPEGVTYQEIMCLCMHLLDMCEMIFLMEGWQHSNGCNAEVAHALEKKITITYEGGRG